MEKEWLLALLPLPRGLPSDDTYRRVLSALSPASFKTAFQRWIKIIVSCLAGDIIPIDDKQIRELSVVALRM